MFWLHEAVIATRLSPDEAWNIRKHWDSQWFAKEFREKCQKKHRKIWWLTYLTYFWLASDFWHPKSQTLLSRPAMSRHRCDFSNCCSVSVTDDPHSRSQLGPWCPDGHPGRRWRRRTSPGVSNHFSSWNMKIMKQHAQPQGLASGGRVPKTDEAIAKGWKRAVAVFFFL